MRADRLQTNTYPISHRPARAALCMLLGAGILVIFLRRRYITHNRAK